MDYTDAAGNVLASHVGTDAYGGALAPSQTFGTCVTTCAGDPLANNYNPDADIIDNTLCDYLPVMILRLVTTKQ